MSCTHVIAFRALDVVKRDLDVYTCSLCGSLHIFDSLSLKLLFKNQNALKAFKAFSVSLCWRSLPLTQISLFPVSTHSIHNTQS